MKSWPQSQGIVQGGVVIVIFITTIDITRWGLFLRISFKSSTLPSLATS